MEDQRPRKGVGTLMFFVGAIIGAGMTYMVLKPDTAFLFSTNVKENNNTEGPGLLTSAGTLEPTILKEQKRNYDKWDELLPKIQVTLSSLFSAKKLTLPTLLPKDIGQIVDINGDGETEAVFEIQTEANPLTYITILTKNGESAETVKVKNDKGKTENFFASKGTLNKTTTDFMLLAQDRSFYTTSRTQKEGEISETCIVQLYQWNQATKLFEYNKILSDVAKQNVCE